MVADTKGGERWSSEGATAEILALFSAAKVPPPHPSQLRRLVATLTSNELGGLADIMGAQSNSKNLSKTTS
jgi:hypothetical protein